MAKSRYTGSQIVDKKYFASYRLPKLSAGLKNIDLLAGVDTREYTYKVGDRLDHLAAKFFGEDRYWWVIALVNNINYPFASGGLIPGKTLKIPLQVQSVLDKIMR